MNHIKFDNETPESSFPIAIVVSKFNEDITSRLLDGALDRLKQYNFDSKDITVVEVPGAVEIPLTVKCLAKQKAFNAIVALGAVIRGETSHYDYVCSQVSEGCQKIALEYDIPVIFGVLTTENIQQAFQRVGGNHGHKGKDAIDAAISMNYILHKIA